MDFSGSRILRPIFLPAGPVRDTRWRYSTINHSTHCNYEFVIDFFCGIKLRNQNSYMKNVNSSSSLGGLNKAVLSQVVLTCEVYIG